MKELNFVDGPLDEVLAKKVEDKDELLRFRAWEVEESPRDLGYRVVKGWPTLP